MKSIARLFVAVCACNALALTIFAGPEPMASGKEMKEVIPPPPPPCCDWTGFYLGLHAGGQFGHSEDNFTATANNGDEFSHAFGYSESGFVGGGQIGYNWQWRWLVLGAESDVGYMNLDGSGHLFHDSGFPAESDSDFYATFRGRLGVAAGCNWLFYATGGAIGVNYETSATFEPDPEVFDVHKQDFNWGYTVGGGIERRLGCHWSIKLEYLYFSLEDQSTEIDANIFNNAAGNAARARPSIPGGKIFPVKYGLDGETTGHIVRAGLNFHF